MPRMIRAYTGAGFLTRGLLRFGNSALKTTDTLRLTFDSATMISTATCVPTPGSPCGTSLNSVKLTSGTINGATLDMINNAVAVNAQGCNFASGLATSVVSSQGFTSSNCTTGGGVVQTGVSATFTQIGAHKKIHIALSSVVISGGNFCLIYFWHRAFDACELEDGGVYASSISAHGCYDPGFGLARGAALAHSGNMTITNIPGCP